MQRPVFDIEIPMGLSMALARSPEAMQWFGTLTAEQQRQVIEQTHTIGSKQEMREFVEQLAAGGKSAGDNQWVSTGIPAQPDQRIRKDGPGGN